MRRINLGLVALLWSAAVSAGNNLHFGPPPAWVRPVPLPASGAATRAALKILLIDHQVELTPKTVSYYVESVSRIQTSQGLNKLGTLSVAWDPDTDRLTINKIHIIRGGKVINVLASGQKFTVVKREANLASATLDDTLTAILQPADLQIGDTLDVAYTLERTDPVLAGHPAAVIEVPPGLPVSELHIRAQWPASETIRWHATRGLSDLHRFHDGAIAGVSLTMRHVQPILQPKAAPLRFLVDRRIDFTSFRSWAQLARLFAPIYRRAEQLQPNSPLRAQIARIRAATDDPKRRAALALRLVENKVRYVFLDLNQGGLVPAGADLTWSRRFGDCKAKTVLLIALLRGLGIEAQPVLVNTFAGDGLNDRLPMMLFNHALVRASIGGKTYWLDGTRLGDRSLGKLHTPYDHWGLPLQSHAAQLVPLVPRPLALPQVEIIAHIDESSGIADPAPFRAQTVLRGDVAFLMEQRLVNLTAAQRNEALRRYWSAQYDYVKIKSVSAKYAKKRDVERLMMEGTSSVRWWKGRYQLKRFTQGYEADFTRQPGPNRNAPYAVPYPSYIRASETIRLPDGGQGFDIVGADIDHTLAGVEYKRRASIRHGTFRVVMSVRSVATEFPAAAAAKYQKALRAMAKATLRLDAPRGHTPTAAELKWGLPKTDSTPGRYVTSAFELIDHWEFAGAIADFNAALAYDYPNARALVGRAVVYALEGNAARARRDLSVALATHRHSWLLSKGRGLAAFDAGNYAGAVAAFTLAIHKRPADPLALRYRAMAYLREGKPDLALSDLERLSRQTPENTAASVWLYWFRAELLVLAGKSREAAGQARKLIDAYPRIPVAYYTAAAIYRASGDSHRADEAMKRGLAVMPSPIALVMRARYWPWRELAERRADLEAALKAAPGSPALLMLLAQAQAAAGEEQAEIASLDLALHDIKVAAVPARRAEQWQALVPELLALRGGAYEKIGNREAAQSDFATARKRAVSPGDLNNLCWQLATVGVSLHGALGDCNAAIAKRPYDPDFLDSRGFALMRLGHYRQAIASYDSALRLNPGLATSLYGRGICELRVGATRAGDADIRLAKLFSFEVVDQFAHYGIRP